MEANTIETVAVEEKRSDFLTTMIILLWILTGLNIVSQLYSTVKGDNIVLNLVEIATLGTYLYAGFLMWQKKRLGLWIYLGIKVVRIVMLFTLIVPQLHEAMEQAIANSAQEVPFSVDFLANISITIVLMGMLFFPILFLTRIKELK